MTPEAGVPSDNTTLSSVLIGLAEEGYTGQLASTPDGGLECLTCGVTSHVETFDELLERRLEGASDPSDELMVLAGRCPACRAGGTVVLGFGPEASATDAAVVAALSHTSR